MNDALAFHGASLQHALLQLQNIHGITVKLLTLRRNGNAFRSAHNELGVQLLLQLINVGAYGWLGQKELAGSLGKAFFLHYGNEALELLKLHGPAPP